MYEGRFSLKSALTAGITVIEIIVVLAILSILLGIGGLGIRPPSERTAANSIQSFLQQGRFDAIKTNRPVVVAFEPGSHAFTATRMTSSTETRCDQASLETRRLPLSEYRGITPQRDEFAILWLPTGQPRACPSGTAPLDLEDGASFTVSGRRGAATATVTVSSAGEVVIR